MLSRDTTYNKKPFVAVSADADLCTVGWDAIAARLRSRLGQRTVVCVECYPGVLLDELRQSLAARLQPDLMLKPETAFRSTEYIDGMLSPHLTNDPVFGRMNDVEIEHFFDCAAVRNMRSRIEECHAGLIVLVGTGAAYVAGHCDVLVYANMARWEIQRRQRLGQIGNLGADNANNSPGLKYKRAFFVDWPAADRTKCRLFPKIDFLLDTNSPATPKMISGQAFREGLVTTVRRPFSVVPFFDPGPWGGSWMKQAFSLPPDARNYAWGFNCVPEENSLLLGFGERRVEVPALDVVLNHPRELLGAHVFERFGAEFPIRFDFLDTMDGGNLSLQVHPLEGYLRENFGMAYTQDESYYLLQTGEGATVYLGLREDIDPAEMERDLRRAAGGGYEFPADKYVNRWPARKHDHFLIPGGTVHCSGAGSVVLEISATPYIFTFKLWDWDRLGLDGHPRPTHLDHGVANIQWNRRTSWVQRELINRVQPIASRDEWREESTGLHELEFIETRRHWFRSRVEHDTQDNLNVLCLVEGRQAIIESEAGSFEPFAVNYAEAFIVPAAVGKYSIRSADGDQCATVKAYVRTE
jgi:mannose-6-phosphate isomerase class I